VVQEFNTSFEAVKDGIDLQWIFKNEAILKELDEKLDNFVEVREEVRYFHKEVKKKYQVLNLLEPHEVAS
jgi:hypothetical protein